MLLHQYTTRQLENLATEVKNLVVGFLSDYKFLTEEQAVDLRHNHAIIIRKKSFFRRFLSGKKKDDLYYIMVKQQSLTDDETKDAPESKEVSVGEE